MSTCKTELVKFFIRSCCNIFLLFLVHCLYKCLDVILAINSFTIQVLIQFPRPLQISVTSSYPTFFKLLGTKQIKDHKSRLIHCKTSHITSGIQTSIIVHLPCFFLLLFLARESWRLIVVLSEPYSSYYLLPHVLEQGLSLFSSSFCFYHGQPLLS